MKQLFFVLVVALLGSSLAFAQDWMPGSQADTDYNCELVRDLVSAFGQIKFIRQAGVEFRLTEHFAAVAPHCFSFFAPTAAETSPSAQQDAGTDQPPFTVTVDTAVNLRICPGINCLRVGVARAGDVLEVVSEEADWYEVVFGKGSAYIAGWLTERLVSES